MSEASKNRWITIITFSFGVLFTIIGFFASLTLNNIKDELSFLRRDINNVQDSVSSIRSLNNLQEWRITILENQLLNQTNRKEKNE